jgi:hypothetical protein
MIEVATDTCLLGFTGRGYIKSHAFDASTLAPVGGVNEVQTVTVTGTPTGGTFTLKYRGQETAAIAYNAAASAVASALQALSNIGASGVTAAGGALPGTAVTVTFTGPLGNTDVFMLQLGTNSLTGGTTPNVTVAQTTQGVANDPRILLGSASKPGTIVTQSTTNPKTLKEYTGSGTIVGVVDGVEEFITNTLAGNKDVAVYCRYCIFDGGKIKNYATYQSAFDTWATANFCDVESPA